MDQAAVRVGLIGYGLAGAVFHARLVASTPGLELVSVVTGNPDRQAQARREHPGVTVLGQAGELWQTAAEHDLVVLATTNSTHLPLGLAAVQAGLAVVVDKPLALTAAEGRRLVTAARERGVLLTVFHNRRWDGDLRTLRRLLGDGALGRVHRFESRFERWRPTPRPGSWRELERPEAGGGLLLDLGSHLVDQALLLFGPARTVYAEVDRRRQGVEGDDDVFVALEHAGGVRSHLWASALAAQLGPRLRVLGDRAAYVKHGLDVQEDALRAGHRPTEPGWGREPRERWGWLGVDGELRQVETEPGAYQSFYAGLAGALRTGGPPPVDPGDAVAVLGILDAARQSAASGTTVRL
ncbi:MAG TPA: Gfo/Idh/MocA family oxidoreductase [Actinomycetota bacterium]|jgi:predicted dehydrogenase